MEWIKQIYQKRGLYNRINDNLGYIYENTRESIEQIINENLPFLKEQSPEVIQYLFSHYAYDSLQYDDEKIVPVLESIYRLKMKLIQTVPVSDQKNILKYQQEQKYMPLEKVYIDNWVLLYYPQFLPLVQKGAFAIFMNGFQFEQGGFALLEDQLYEALDNLNERRQSKILELMNHQKLDPHTQKFTDYLTYSDLTLDTYRNFVASKEDSTMSQIFFATLYQTINNSYESLPILRLFKNGSDTFYQEVLEEISKRKEVNFSYLTNLDSAILDRYLENKEETAKDRLQLLLHPSFQKMSLPIQTFLLESLQEDDDKNLFQLKQKAYLKEGMEDVLLRARPKQKNYQTYLDVEDSSQLKERIALWDISFFKKQIPVQLKAMKFIETAETKEMEIERKKLVQLDGLLESPLSSKIMERMTHVSTKERAIKFVGQVAVTILEEDDETIRESLFQLLPGDVKEISLGDGLVLQIPDYTYVKKMSEQAPLVLENKQHTKVLMTTKRS